MDPLYLVSNGVVVREANSLTFVNKEGKRHLPVESLSEIFCLGRITITSGAASLLMKKKKPVHFFNYYGFYEGSLMPREQQISGLVIVKQVEHYSDPEKRISIAREMVNGIKNNVVCTLRYYCRRGEPLTDYIEEIEKVEIGKSINSVLSSEGKIWDGYYESFNKIVKGLEMEKREIRPPKDEMNALISFGNSLLYGVALSEIYHTYLHPAISFLHEPRERRYSLALDIADIFKPVIVERLIFKLVNNQQIKKEDFDRQVGVVLKEKSRRLFIEEFDKKLKTSLNHPELKRSVTYRELLRFECYKLVKHIIGEKPYKAFRMWW